MQHAILGTLSRTEHDWRGMMALPLFFARGVALREPSAPRGLLPIRIEDLDGDGPTLEQDRALKYLLAHEAEVLGAVWIEMLSALGHFSLEGEAACFKVEVSRLHADGVAFLGFGFEAEAFLEHGLAVAHHPTRGTFWSDAEALNQIEKADNLPPRPDEGGDS